FQAEDGIRDLIVTGVQTCALPISRGVARPGRADTPPRDGRCAPTPHTPAARGWSLRSRGSQRAPPLRRGGGTSRVARVAPSTPTRHRPDCRRPVETLAVAAPDRAS